MQMNTRNIYSFAPAVKRYVITKFSYNNCNNYVKKAPKEPNAPLNVNLTLNEHGIRFSQKSREVVYQAAQLQNDVISILDIVESVTRNTQTDGC